MSWQIFVFICDFLIADVKSAVIPLPSDTSHWFQAFNYLVTDSVITADSLQRIDNVDFLNQVGFSSENGSYIMVLISIRRIVCTAWPIHRKQLRNFFYRFRQRFVQYLHIQF
jgi:hypothetical protein